MRIKSMSTLLAIGLTVLGSSQICAHASVTLDQSMLAPVNEGCSINDGFQFVAQTYTAGISGALTGVSIDVNGFYSSGPRSNPLSVSIQTVVHGQPTGSKLAQTTLSGSSSPLTSMVTFTSMVTQVSGQQYAIVVTYPDAPPHGPNSDQGEWTGATGNKYAGGGLFVSNDENSWFAYTDIDQHFKTFVTPGAVPEPSAIMAFAIGASGLLWFIRRKARLSC